MKKYIVIWQKTDGTRMSWYANDFNLMSEYENGMIVVDLGQNLITYDGMTWDDVDAD